MKRIVRTVIFLFSLFFLIATVAKSQKSFNAHFKQLASCNEGIITSLSFDSLDFINSHDLHVNTDDEAPLFTDDSFIFCIKPSKLILLTISVLFALLAINRLYVINNKFNELTIRHSTVF